MIGYGPDQVDRWEPYQILAVYRGWKLANAPSGPRAPSDAEFEAAIARTMH